MKGIPGEPSDWICLAHHESGLDTNLIQQKYEHSLEHYGIFQVNQTHCHGHSRKRTPRLCDLSCQGLTDNALADDIECAGNVYLNHGFEAWEAWRKYCAGEDTSPYIDGC